MNGAILVLPRDILYNDKVSAETLGWRLLGIGGLELADAHTVNEQNVVYHIADLLDVLSQYFNVPKTDDEVVHEVELIITSLLDCSYDWFRWAYKLFDKDENARLFILRQQDREFSLKQDDFAWRVCHEERFHDKSILIPRSKRPEVKRPTIIHDGVVRWHKNLHKDLRVFVLPYRMIPDIPLYTVDNFWERIVAYFDKDDAAAHSLGVKSELVIVNDRHYF